MLLFLIALITPLHILTAHSDCVAGGCYQTTKGCIQNVATDHCEILPPTVAWQLTLNDLKLLLLLFNKWLNHNDITDSL